MAFMKSFTRWSLPVAISLLLHAALIALITYQLSNNSTVRIPLQTVTVELAGQAPTKEKKPRLHKSKPIAIATPIKESAKSEQPVIVKAVPEKSETSTAIPEQASADKQAIDTATEAKQAGLEVQPISKLTRRPSFLHRIEPVYPIAEQRAGSQAYVLAEVTIDEKGNVLAVRIVKSAGNSFDNAVIDALKKSSFRPGYIDKEAVAVRVAVPFRFKLK